MKKFMLFLPLAFAALLLFSCNNGVSDEVCYRCSVDYMYNGQQVLSTENYCYVTDDSTATTQTGERMEECDFFGGDWNLQ